MKYATIALALVLGACQTTPPANACAMSFNGDLAAAMHRVESKLASGCEFKFDQYFQSLLAQAAENPDADNRMLFSNHLMNVHDAGIISRRQAETLYNRYFGVKFVSMRGEYNTCSQVCPMRTQVVSDMKAELHDKELGPMRASSDSASFYRADNLLREADLVLEATCRACAAGNVQ